MAFTWFRILCLIVLLVSDYTWVHRFPPSIAMGLPGVLPRTSPIHEVRRSKMFQVRLRESSGDLLAWVARGTKTPSTNVSTDANRS